MMAMVVGMDVLMLVEVVIDPVKVIAKVARRYQVGGAVCSFKSLRGYASYPSLVERDFFVTMSDM